MTSFDTELSNIASRFILFDLYMSEKHPEIYYSLETAQNKMLHLGFKFISLLVLVNAGVVKRQVSMPIQESTTSLNCPAGWDPSPCKCRDGAGETASVICDDAKTGDEIKSAFAKLDTAHKFVNFFIEGSNVESLPGGVFGKASFTMFFISNSKLNKLDDDVFKGSEETANHFLLQNNNFEKFNFNSLKPLKNLQNFELSRGKLTEVPDDAFGEKPLEVIDLNGNQIKTLGKNAFKNLAKLKKIDLSNNKLTELKEDSLNLSPEISPISLLLSHNEISKIDKNAFKNVKVRVLEIEDNKLEYLDQEIFEPLVKSLEDNHGSISTLGNPFSCDSANTKWVSEQPGLQKGLIIGYMCRDGRALQQVSFSE